MNTKLRKNQKMALKKYFLKISINSVFGKTMKNVRNHRDMRLVTTNKNEANLYQNLIIIQQNSFLKVW